MILSLIIIAFILGMGVLWATYGLFSAFLHLLVVLAAGSIALAFWEPITVALLLPYIPAYAWGVGLILPFGVALIVLRLALDRIVRGNVYFPPLINQVLGGAVGALAAALTAGFTLIGVNYLPLGLSVLGYQPYEVTTAGTVQPKPGGNLWVPVDRWAATTWGTLSEAGFRTRRPLADVRGDLAYDAGTFRLSRFYDERSSLVANVGTVDATRAVVLDADPQGLPDDMVAYLTQTAPNRAGDRLVAVLTAWESKPDTVTFDTDRILRVPPPQVQLLAEGPDGALTSYLPVAFSSEPVGATQRRFFPVADNAALASATGVTSAQIAWLYAVPRDADPAFLKVRNLRLALPDPEGDAAAGFADLAGLFVPEGQDMPVEGAPPPTDPTIAGDGRPTVSPEMIGYLPMKAIDLQQSVALPTSISPNQAPGLSFTSDGERLVSGTDVVERGSRGKVRSIDIAPALRGIRLQVEPFSSAVSGLGQARQAASNVQEFWISDTRDRPYFAVGYAVQQEDNRLKVNFPGGGMVRNTSELGLNELRSGEQMYIYFVVPPGVQLKAFHVGEAYQELNLTVGDQPTR